MTVAGECELGNMMPISLYIDADACPVKQEIYRVAERHAGKGVFLVTTGLDPVVDPDRPHGLPDQACTRVGRRPNPCVRQ